MGAADSAGKCGGSALPAENERHRFVQETLRDAGVDAVPVEAFAVWTAKMRPVIQ